MYGKLMYNLYKIPSCKVVFYMLYYRQKEKGVESNDLKEIQILKVNKLQAILKLSQAAGYKPNSVERNSLFT